MVGREQYNNAYKHFVVAVNGKWNDTVWQMRRFRERMDQEYQKGRLHLRAIRELT